jgi:uridine phosphorylase
VIHIQQTAELAERVLLPGDPGRALRLAQRLLDQPKMLNHNRGLWGYTGTAADGLPLSIQSTGIGGPSAAIVAHELIELGARRLLRVGTCRALDQELRPGQLMIASEALSDDGTSRALAGHERLAGLPASVELLAGLRGAASDAGAGDPIACGPSVSTDLFYDAADHRAQWREAGALVVEMQAAAIFAVAARKGVEGGCALLVVDTAPGGPQQLDEQTLHEREIALGELAVRALMLHAEAG